MATKEIIGTVKKALNDIEPDGKLLLDVSCGKGELLLALKDSGFKLRGTRLERKYFGFVDLLDGTGIKVDEPVDLLEGLPYPDSSVDVVVCIEVLEHLENHRRAISELSRVLKAGGILILSTPNIMRLTSRLHFLLTGLHKARRPAIPYQTSLEESMRYHNYPAYLPVLDYLLYAHRLDIVEFLPCNIKAPARVLYYLLYPAIMLDTWFTLRFREMELAASGDWRRLFRMLTNPYVLVGDLIFIKAIKLPFN